MPRNPRRTAVEREEVREKERERGEKKGGNREEETHGSTLRSRERARKKKKENPSTRLLQFSCDLLVAFRQTRPWSSFHGGNTLDIHLAASFLLLLPFHRVRLPPRFIIKIANPPDPAFSLFFYSKNETNPFCNPRDRLQSSVYARYDRSIGPGVLPGTHWFILILTSSGIPSASFSASNTFPRTRKPRRERGTITRIVWANRRV